MVEKTEEVVLTERGSDDGLEEEEVVDECAEETAMGDIDEEDEEEIGEIFIFARSYLKN